jgi:hypothetical protein
MYILPGIHIFTCFFHLFTVYLCIFGSFSCSSHPDKVFSKPENPVIHIWYGK